MLLNLWECIIKKCISKRYIYCKYVKKNYIFYRTLMLTPEEYTNYKDNSSQKQIIYMYKN